uniref:Protein E7 n=1 Tax=Eidolon bat papillomavirus TaxID=3141875 RepID=A0AAU7E2Y2_9PAPI
MIGPEGHRGGDITLALEAATAEVPVAINSEEEESEEELVDYSPFKVLVSCGLCSNKVKVNLLATAAAIRSFQTLVIEEELFVVCPACGNSAFQQRNGV